MRSRTIFAYCIIGVTPALSASRCQNDPVPIVQASFDPSQSMRSLMVLALDLIEIHPEWCFAALLALASVALLLPRILPPHASGHS